MITFDGEYSVICHFEMTEEEAEERGGVDFDSLKKSINELTDYILIGVYDKIELGEKDFIAVNPIEKTLMADGKEIELEEEDSDEFSSEVKEIFAKAGLIDEDENKENKEGDSDGNKNEI